MFELENAITRWRRELAAAGIHRASALDELESHLRDELEQQLGAGLTPEAAFKAAVARIGEPRALNSEFLKISGRKFRSLAKIFRFSCFVTAPVMFVAGAWGTWDRGLMAWPRAVGFAVLCAAAGYIAALPFVYRKLPNPERPGVASVLKLMSLWFGVLPILALLDALELIHLHADYATVEVFSYLYVVITFTGLAYACRGLDLRDNSTTLGAENPSNHHELTTAALAAAPREAARLGHDFVGTEHILLGILANQTDLLKNVFHSCGLDRDSILAEIVNLIPPGPGQNKGELPYTPRAKAALNFAKLEAEAMNHPHLCVEHLLLGVLREKQGVAGMVLREQGLDFAKTRAAILRAWKDGDEGGSALVPAS